jgi:hypothetical protein
MATAKKPISAKRLAANRANAARSTGPRTPQGKARSSQNSRLHQFHPDYFAVVRLEEVGALARMRADLIATYQPVNSQELFAIERMAFAQQAMSRAYALETGILTACMNEAIDPEGYPLALLRPDLTRDAAVTTAQNRAYVLAEGFIALSKSSNIFQLFFRYQAQSERLYRRAVDEFERLRKLRPELPEEIVSEPIFAPQPQETTAPPAASTNPTDPRNPPFTPLARPIPVDPTIAITSPNPPGPPRHPRMS